MVDRFLGTEKGSYCDLRRVSWQQQSFFFSCPENRLDAEFNMRLMNDNDVVAEELEQGLASSPATHAWLILKVLNNWGRGA